MSAGLAGTSKKSASSMSEAIWKGIATTGPSPGDACKGIPPVPQAEDSYPDRWKKLVWMEYLASVQAFLRELKDPKSKLYNFDKAAELTVSVSSGPDKKGLFQVVVEGVTPPNFVLPEESNHPADFVHGLLKLPEGQGWIYMQNVQFPEDGGREHHGPVRGQARVFAEGFSPAGSAAVENRHAKTKCILFTEFNSCYNRFEALRQYHLVASDLRAAIEGVEHRMNGSDCLMPPPGPGIQTKLNNTQLEIMRTVRGPLDFVQGPPGTGKSTFIVELLFTRIPIASRVLLCTTTNRAIDSLTEKIHASGSGKVVAFGNPKRLGETSLKLTLEQQYLEHPSQKAAVKLYEAAQRTFTQWQNSLWHLEELIGSDDSGDLLKASGERKKMLKAAGKFINSLSSKLDELVACKSHAPNVIEFLQGRVKSVEKSLKPLRAEPMSIENVTVWLQQLTELSRISRSKIKYAVKMEILLSAKYFVCTAASAVRLQRKIAKEVFPPSSEGDELRAEMQPSSSRPAAEASSTQSVHLGALAAKLTSALLKCGSIAAKSDKSIGNTVSNKKKVEVKHGKIPNDEEELAAVMDFKYVVLDEAGAMLEPDMVGTIIHGCRFLLCVGDHNQLPPFTRWNQAEKWLYSVSLLQRLAERRGAPLDYNLMTVQYRMHPRLAQIVSDTFYRGSLVTADSVVAARERDQPVKFVHVHKGTELRAGTSWKNVDEAHRVVKIVQMEVKTVRKGQHAMSIDILTFHKPQELLIKDMLKKRGLLKEGEVEVMTVDSMQGREADIVVLSCVRSGQRNSIGFLRCPKRLNVGLSRAREQLYIVGERAGLLRCGTAEWRNVLRHECLEAV